MPQTTNDKHKEQTATINTKISITSHKHTNTTQFLSLSLSLSVSTKHNSAASFCCNVTNLWEVVSSHSKAFRIYCLGGNLVCFGGRNQHLKRTKRKREKEKMFSRCDRVWKQLFKQLIPSDLDFSRHSGLHVDTRNLYESYSFERVQTVL
jgi:hypothetical protein